MYRKLTDADVDLLKEEITKDPVHSKDPTFNAGIFVDPDGQSIVFEDNEGPWLNNTNFQIQVDVWSAVGTYLGQVGAVTPILPHANFNESPYLYLSIVLASGTLTFKYSFDGINFYNTPLTLSLASYPGAVTHVGLTSASYGTAVTSNSTFDWFRRIS